MAMYYANINIKFGSAANTAILQTIGFSKRSAAFLPGAPATQVYHVPLASLGLKTMLL